MRGRRAPLLGLSASLAVLVAPAIGGLRGRPLRPAAVRARALASVAPREPAAAAPRDWLPAHALEALLVLDIEATCDSPQQEAPHEIIEWPVVALDVRSCSVVAEFRRIVRPTENGTLSRFCTELTGITQAEVDAAQPLDVVLAEFDAWLVERGYLAPDGSPAARFALCTDGPWDLCHFTAAECARKRIAQPAYLRTYVNVRKAFCKAYKLRGPRGMSLKRQLAKLGLRYEGRPHSGIDDARNIARVAAALVARRKPQIFVPNEEVSPLLVGRPRSLHPDKRCAAAVFGAAGPAPPLLGSAGVRGPKKARGRRAKQELELERAAPAPPPAGGADAAAAPR